MMKQYNTHGSKQNLIACYVLFDVFLNWDLSIDDYVVHKGDSQNITFNLVQFQVDILGVFFDCFKICFQKKWISVRIDCSKDYSKESNSVLFWSVMTLSVDQTIVIIKIQKLDGSHGNDMGETRIYQRQKIGT